MGGLLSSSPAPAKARREFLWVEDAEGSRLAGGSPSIKVVTYNILCEAYATDRSFPPDTNPREHLAWAGREAKLIEEISTYAPDLLFLQEVQGEAWGGDGDDRPGSLGATLRATGYEGAWFWGTPPPPGAPPSSLKPPRKGSTPPVGPALLVRSARFTVRRFASIAFRDARCREAITGGHAPTATLLAACRDGAVAALLEDKERGGALILAASAHINWDYRTPDLKVLQCVALMDELKRFMEVEVVGSGGGGGGGAPSRPPPLILGGDFNSLPFERPSNEAPGAPSCAGQPSGAYTLLTTGALTPGHPHHPARQRGGPAGVSYGTAGWTLASVRVAAGGAEPAFTTRTTQFEGTLDYIFVSTGDWSVAAVLADPWGEGEAEEAEEEAACEDGEAVATRPRAPSLAAFPPTPNAVWPSDHLAVGAVLEPL